MAGAVVEIQSVPPQKLPRQWIELRAGNAVGKHRARDRDMTLENKRKVPSHVGARRADRDRAGNVGGAILVLAAGIDQEQFAGCNAPVGPPGDAVMHDGAVRSGAGDGGKRNVL